MTRAKETGAQAWAGRYIGLPFEDCGRDPNGVDCWGLFRMIFREQAGIELPSFSTDYTSSEDRLATARLLDDNRGPEWVEIDKAELRPLDALLLPTLGVLNHVGVCAGGTNFLHVEVGVNAALADWTAQEWRRRFERAKTFRHAELCDAG